MSEDVQEKTDLEPRDVQDGTTIAPPPKINVLSLVREIMKYNGITVDIPGIPGLEDIMKNINPK